MEQFIIITILAIVEIQIIILIALQPKRLFTARKRISTLIDTSVLMDGRIIQIAESGFIPSDLTIPRSVLMELQLLADGSDSTKRSRARHGLDVAKQLQEMSTCKVNIHDSAASNGVDEHLLELAKKYKTSICTIDFNLNKVAQAEGVSVLNINDLAQQLRSSYLPGERVSIAITAKGTDAQQGVGYMADGTMVVVDHAKADIGKQVTIEFLKTIQTAAGKMLFAKKIETERDDKKQRPVQAAKTEKVTGRKKPAIRNRKTNEDSLVELANKT